MKPWKRRDSHDRGLRSLRLALVGALTAGLLVALAGFGGLGYAASGVSRAVESAVHAVSPTKQAAPDGSLSSASAQYVVAMCLRGHTIFVDNHAMKGIIRAGGKLGSCGGAAAPRGSRKLKFICFHGQSIKVQKRSVRTMIRLGAKKGKCKKK